MYTSNHHYTIIIMGRLAPKGVCQIFTAASTAIPGQSGGSFLWSVRWCTLLVNQVIIPALPWSVRWIIPVVSQVVHSSGQSGGSLLWSVRSCTPLVSQVDHSCGQSGDALLWSSGGALLWSVRWIIPVVRWCTPLVCQVDHSCGQSGGSFLWSVRWYTPLVSQVDHSCGQSGGALLWSVRWIIPLVKQCPVTFSSLHSVPSNTPFHTMPSSQGDCADDGTFKSYNKLTSPSTTPHHPHKPCTH